MYNKIHCQSIWHLKTLNNPHRLQTMRNQKTLTANSSLSKRQKLNWTKPWWTRIRIRTVTQSRWWTLTMQVTVGLRSWCIVSHRHRKIRWSNMKRILLLREKHLLTLVQNQETKWFKLMMMKINKKVKTKNKTKEKMKKTKVTMMTMSKNQVTNTLSQLMRSITLTKVKWSLRIRIEMSTYMMKSTCMTWR